MKRTVLVILNLLLYHAAIAQALPLYDPSGPGQLALSVCMGKACLTRDGVGPYRPKGLIVLGLATAQTSWARLTPTFRKIEQAFSVNTLLAIRQFGADSVRFNVAQVNLDPQSPYYDAAYAGQIATYVHVARSLKLTALIEINDEEPPNSGRLGMPSEATIRAWEQLAPLFADDQGIMLGVYNEPTVPGTSNADLATWQEAYNRVVVAIRAAGAKNVVVIDGPHFANNLPLQAVSYLVKDSAHNLIYGVHPFPKGRMAFPSGWPELFERFCTASNAVLCQITAWNLYGSVVNGVDRGICPHENAKQYQMPANSQQLFDMAKSLNSGVYGWAFDYPNVIMDSRAPLSRTVGFDNFTDCKHTPIPWGGGELLRRNFTDPAW